jgi:hypothetical protein
MRRNSFVTTLALLALLATASVAQAAPPSTPFSGTWLGQDTLPPVGDGSMEHLVVSGSANNVRIDWQDEFGQACWDAGSTDFWLSADLRGSVTGNTMTGVFRSAKCGHVVLPWKGGTMVWTLNTNGNADPSDDTLFDGVVTWRRV